MHANGGIICMYFCSERQSRPFQYIRPRLHELAGRGLYHIADLGNLASSLTLRQHHFSVLELGDEVSAIIDRLAKLFDGDANTTPLFLTADSDFCQPRLEHGMIGADDELQHLSNR